MCREWDEPQRLKFLRGELEGKRPLMPPGIQASTEEMDVINTFRTLAELPPDSLGAYVISMARAASDVLAVVLLQVRGSAGVCNQVLQGLSRMLRCGRSGAPHALVKPRAWVLHVGFLHLYSCLGSTGS